MSLPIRTSVLAAIVVTMSLSVWPALVQAQEPQVQADVQLPARQPRWEFHLPSGMDVPVAGEERVHRRAFVSAAQVSFLTTPRVAVMSTFGWSRTRDIDVKDSPKMDVLTYDLGAEVRAKRRRVTPFAGIGVGARSHHYRNNAADTTHHPGGYLSGGAELGVHKFRVRLEVRDYLQSRSRQNLVVLAGVRIVGRS